jgi:hypothetical protein
MYAEIEFIYLENQAVCEDKREVRAYMCFEYI